MKLSKNLWLSEVIKSNTAARKGIDNMPTDEHLENLKYLAEKVFQPLREHAGCPIYINSGYRSKELNKAVGGSKSSFHCHGCAIDIDNDNKNTSFDNKQIFEYIKNNLDFTELIYEFGDDNKPDWVHVAIKKGREKEKKIIRAYRINGKTKYKPFK